MGGGSQTVKSGRWDRGRWELSAGGRRWNWLGGSHQRAAPVGGGRWAVIIE